MGQSRLNVATGQPTVHRLALDRHPARWGERARTRTQQESLNGLESRQVAVGLEVEVRKQLKLGNHGITVRLNAIREPVLKLSDAVEIVARHADTPV
jgi:hypothetical protein